MKPGPSLFFTSLLVAIPTQGWAANGPPAASPPAQLVLGNFSGATLSNFGSAVISMALDTSSGKLFVSSRHEILRFSSQAQFTNGAIPEAIFAPTAVSDVSGLAVDGSGHLWAATNNRVIRFDNATTRADAPAPDAVLGQPDLASNTAAAGQSGMNGPKSLALDSSGCLWVADTENNRVLGFLNAAAKSNGATADLLLGQPNWTNAGSGVSASRMTKPKGLTVDGTGRLWVVDNKTRVLRFDHAVSKAIGASADGVLGHSDFFGTLPSDPNARFISQGVTVDAAGRLYISSGGVLRFDNPSAKPNGAAPDGKFIPYPDDTEITWDTGGNGLSPGPAGSLWVASVRSIPSVNPEKVLFRMETPSTATGNVMPAGVLGAVSVAFPSAFTLSKPSVLAEDPQTGKIFVVDTGNHRVLRYPSAKVLNSGAAAEAVFGQPDFSTVAAGTGPGKMRTPQGCVLDASGNLWVSDAGNHRVLRFANAISSADGTPAVVALGQPDLTTNSQRPPSEFSLNTPGPLAIGPGGELWVSELASPITKVVRYNQAATAASGTAASGLLGRVDFYDQQSPTTGSSTLFRTVESLFCDPLGRLWVIARANNAVQTDIYFHLYRFDAAATKPNGAASETTVTLDLVTAAAIPPVPNKYTNVSQPSFYIDSDGSLILFFNSTPFDFLIGNGYTNSYVLRLPDATALPSVVNQPSQVDYVLKLSSFGSSRSVVLGSPLGMIPSAGGFIWATDAISSVQRYKLPPFGSATSQQPESVELTSPSEGGRLAFRFTSIPGRDYQLYTSSNLTQWLPGQKLSAKGATSVFLETPTADKGFFEVMLLP